MTDIEIVQMKLTTRDLEIQACHAVLTATGISLTDVSDASDRTLLDRVKAVCDRLWLAEDSLKSERAEVERLQKYVDLVQNAGRV